MTVVAIDPGYAKSGDGCAVAEFEGARLARVLFARPLRYRPAIRHYVTVVVEEPQQDARSRSVPPAVLIQLSWQGAMLAGLYAGASSTICEVESVTPIQWKGSIPKPVHHGQLWDILTPPEREILGGDATEKAIDAAKRKGALDRWAKPGAAYYPRSFLTHNLLDAVALGATYLGRLPWPSR